MRSLQSMRKIQASNLRNGTIPISHKQFHDLSAKGGVVDKKAADIGCSVKVHVEKASISRLEVEGMHISEDADFPYRMFVVQARYPRPSWWPTRNSTVIKKGMVAEQHRELPLFGLPATTGPALKLGRLFLRQSRPMPLHEKCQIRIVQARDKARNLSLVIQAGLHCLDSYESADE